MNHGIEINGQVRFKQQLNNGNLVKLGTVVSFEGQNNEIAVVSVQDDVRKPTMLASKRQRIPVSQLESVKKAYGRTVVQANPLHRTIGSLLR